MTFTKNLDDYTFVAPSKRKNKKYDVYKKGKYITSFGQVPYSQFFDKIGFYSNLNNNNIIQKKSYYKRHGTKADFESAKYFSHKFLW